MGKLETNEKLNIDVPLDANLNDSDVVTAEDIPYSSVEENTSTAITEYKEVEEPCVALTIIGENRLSDAEVFVRRGLKYSIKAFFSTIVLTIMNLFI